MLKLCLNSYSIGSDTFFCEIASLFSFATCYFVCDTRGQCTTPIALPKVES